MDHAREGLGAESVPATLWVIALVALLPFPLAAVVFSYGPDVYASRSLLVLLTWSAVVLAFLGGVRWGLESAEPAPRWHRLAWSALAPAFGWLVFLARGQFPETWVLLAFMTIFLVQWLFDHQAPDTPSRYPRLSTAVTLAACISLGLTLEKLLNA